MGKIFFPAALWAVIAALSILFVVLTTLLGGVVLKDLWGWFIVPLGVPQLSVIHAIGVSLVVRLMTYDIPKGDDEMSDTIARIISALLYLLAVWGIGAIVHHFM